MIGALGVVGTGLSWVRDVFPYQYSEAAAINDQGQVAGCSYRTPINDPPSTPSGPEGKAFLYQKGADGTANVVTLDPLEGDPLDPSDDDLYSRARDINKFGRAVGWSRGTDGNERLQFSAVLWRNGKATDLNELIPADSRWRLTDDGIRGWTLTDAYAINASGQIVGAGFKDGNDANLSQLRAFLLTPDTTEPKIECDAADGDWHGEDVSIPCTASDGGVGLADPADASFTLTTSVPAGTETFDAKTGSRDVYDNAGNFAHAGPISGNKVDKKAPTFNCPAADGTWHATNPTFNCTASDGGSGLNPVGDANFSLSTSVAPGNETSSASTGTKTLTDAVGNSVTAPAITGVMVDRKAPNTNASTGTYSGGWTNSSVTVTLTPNDGGSGVQKTEYSVDGGAFQAYTSAFSVSSDGDHTILYRSTDNVNNQEENQTLTVKVDKTAPSVNCGMADGDWHAGNVDIACTASDAGSGLADASNDASFDLTTSVVDGDETNNASTESRTVYDNAGNPAEAGPVSGNKVDKKAPSAQATPSPLPNAFGFNNQNVTVNLTATEGGSGVKEIRYVINGGQEQTEAGASKQIPVTTDGTTTVSYYAVDNVGNAAQPKSLTIKLDKTAPKVTTVSPADGATGVPLTPEVVATFSEKMDPATLGKATFKLYKGTTQITAVNVTPNADGTKATLEPNAPLAKSTTYEARVTIGATDLAGNALDQSPKAADDQPMKWTFKTGSR